jgi:hypothetical protein
LSTEKRSRRHPSVGRPYRPEAARSSTGQLAAGDRYGQVIDVLLSEQRDTTAALRFFTCALAQSPAPVALLH